MAEPAKGGEKAELIAALERARGMAAHNLGALRHDLDLPTHFKKAFREHKAAYLASATGLGVVMGWLPFRRKKVYVERKSDKKMKEAGEAGLLLVALKFLFSIVRPALVAFAAKKVTAFAEKGDFSGFSFK